MATRPKLRNTIFGYIAELKSFSMGDETRSPRFALTQHHTLTLLDSLKRVVRGRVSA
jgi:hypothetical protein